MVYAIYQENVGDQYEPDMRMHMVEASDMRELAKKIPEGAEQIYVMTERPKRCRMIKTIELQEEL